MVVQIIATRDRSAGRVDPQHDGHHVFVLADAVDLLFDKAVALQDRTGHGDDCNLFLSLFAQGVEFFLGLAGWAEIFFVTNLQSDEAHHRQNQQHEHHLAVPAQGGRGLLNDNLWRRDLRADAGLRWRSAVGRGNCGHGECSQGAK